MDADGIGLTHHVSAFTGTVVVGAPAVGRFMSATLVTRIFGFQHDGTTLAMGNQRIITIVEIVFLILNLIGLLQTAWRKNNALSDPTDK